MKKEHIEILQTLKKKLPAERFLIGGSNAVRLHGITLPKEPGDLDVILELPLPHAVNNLERYQTENPNPKFTGRADMSYSFFIDEVKVDVWIKKELSVHPLLSYEGILVNSIADIVEAKMKFNRPKDWVQLMQWSQSIYNKTTFENSLMGIGSSEDYDLTNADDLTKEDSKKPYDPLAVASDPWDVDMEDDLPF